MSRSKGHPVKLRYRMRAVPSGDFAWVRARNDSAAIREGRLAFEAMGIQIKRVEIVERPYIWTDPGW